MCGEIRLNIHNINSNVRVNVRAELTDNFFRVCLQRAQAHAQHRF